MIRENRLSRAFSAGKELPKHKIKVNMTKNFPNSLLWAVTKLVVTAAKEKPVTWTLVTT